MTVFVFIYEVPIDIGDLSKEAVAKVLYEKDGEDLWNPYELTQDVTLVSVAPKEVK